MTIIWYMVAQIWSITVFFVILDHFLHFYPPNNTKNQNFEKREKIPGDIILHMCTINDNYMMYGSWDIKHKWQNFLSFWTIFCPFTPPPPPPLPLPSKNLKNTILHRCTKNHDHVLQCSWDPMHDGYNS